MKKQKKATSQTVKFIKVVLFVVATVLIFRFCASILQNQGDNTNIDLKAQVDFTGTQFVIKNNDSFDYNDVTITAAAMCSSGLRTQN